MLQGSANIKGRNSEFNLNNFSFIFENAYGELDIRKLRMFVTALWAVYFSTDGPDISIDPIAPGIDKHLVRYIGQVINLDIGRVMREADYTMKKWAVGTESADVPGFKSPAQIAAERGVFHVGAYSRFWFVPEEMRFIKTDKLLLFDSGRCVNYILGFGGQYKVYCAVGQLVTVGRGIASPTAASKPCVKL